METHTIHIKDKQFNSLVDVFNVFSDEEICKHHLAELRWNGNPQCVYCNSTDIFTMKVKGRGTQYKCKHCRKQFSVRVGTIFHSTKIPLQKWFVAMYLITSHKKGISSHQLAKDLGVTQKTAWFMLHRLRYAMEAKSFDVPMEGTIEIDDTYIDGKEKKRTDTLQRELRIHRGVL